MISHPSDNLMAGVEYIYREYGEKVGPTTHPSERFSEDALVESTYALMHEHGWTEHFHCGWEDGAPVDGMCGKETAERESVRDIVRHVRNER